MANSQLNEVIPVNQTIILNTASGILPVAFNAWSYGPVQCDAIYCNNTDSVDHKVAVSVVSGGNTVVFGSVNVPAGSGSGGLPSVEVLQASLGNTLAAVVLGPSDTLQVAVEVVLGATKIVGCFLVSGALASG